MGLITVPSLEYIVEHGSYYEFLRDHIAYYRFETLRKLAELHGFAVLEEELVNRDTCAVILRKVEKGREESIKKAWIRDGEIRKEDFSALAASQVQIGKEMEKLACSLKEKGETLALWGASHQGFTLAATTCLGEAAEYMIDSAPFKQGRFAPRIPSAYRAPGLFPPASGGADRDRGAWVYEGDCRDYPFTFWGKGKDLSHAQRPFGGS